MKEDSLDIRACMPPCRLSLCQSPSPLLVTQPCHAPCHASTKPCMPSTHVPNLLYFWPICRRCWLGALYCAACGPCPHAVGQSGGAYVRAQEGQAAAGVMLAAHITACDREHVMTLLYQARTLPQCDMGRDHFMTVDSSRRHGGSGSGYGRSSCRLQAAGELCVVCITCGLVMLPALYRQPV